MNLPLMTNSYLSLPELFYKRCQAASFPKVKLLLFNESLSKELGFPYENYTQDELAQIFSGQKILNGSEPIALAYAGFQFAHPVPLLGDGRALMLGELNGFDIQLKGSGQTPFSRRGDGRSALGPVIREYIVSEFMNTVGVPTTRALAAVSTGEDVYRQFGPEPGGVFTRVASSHLRVGTFQYLYFKQDLSSLGELLNYTVNRHYPELKDLNQREKALGLLEKFATKQGKLIADWTKFGFIHGVMNTDNCSLAGITIDYGPCAFMDEFKFHQVFSSIDGRGRYSFFNQLSIIQWNILRLADCLLPLISSHQEQAIADVEERLQPILNKFSYQRMTKLVQKLGINDYQDSDEDLVMIFLKYLEEESLDFTLAFRNLPNLFYGRENGFYPQNEKLEEFLSSWKKRVSQVEHLDSVNPIYIPRNHLIQKAIDLSYMGDISFAQKLLEVLKDPYSEKEEFSEFSLPPQEHERVIQTFCGT